MLSFCGNEANVRNGPKVHLVRTLDFLNSIFKVWSQRRLEFVHDLPTADAVCHQRVKLGRPKNERKADAFKKVAFFPFFSTPVIMTMNKPWSMTADLLKVVWCMCKTNCDIKRCSYRKHGLECTSDYGECCGISCSNSPRNIYRHTSLNR